MLSPLMLSSKEHNSLLLAVYLMFGPHGQRFVELGTYHLDDSGGLGLIQEDFQVFTSFVGGNFVGICQDGNEFVDGARLFDGFPDGAADLVEAEERGQIGDSPAHRDDEGFSGDDPGNDIVRADEL